MTDSLDQQAVFVFVTYTIYDWLDDKDIRKCLKTHMERGMEKSDVRLNKEEARDALYEAIEDGDENTVKEIIEKFPSILSINSTVYFTCFLHLACMHNQAHICVKLLDNGADVNKVDDAEDTSLHVAVVHKADREIIRTLISYGANVFKQNGKGLSPFLLACMSGSFETVHELSKCAKLPKNHMDVYNKNGLHQAVQNCSDFDQTDSLKDSIELLLKLGIDINDKDYYGNTVLHLASQEKAYDLIPCLLDLGADPFLRDNYGDTFMTVLEGTVNTEECRELFPLVIQNIQEIKHQNTDEEVINGKELVKQFLNIRNLKGKSLMYLFLFQMDTSTLKILIDWGADVNLQDNLGKTPLHECVRRENEHAKLNLLLENGARTDIRDICQRTPLYEARDVHTTEILLAHGSDPNVSDKIGMSPIHVAALDHLTDIIPVLLSHGTNINSKNRHGSTALHFASWFGYSEVIKVLEECGADVTVIDNNGYTAEDVQQELAKSSRHEIPIMESNELGKSEIIQCQSHLIAMDGKIRRPGDETVDELAAHLLSTPRIGLLKNVGETAYIKSAVFDVLGKIAAYVCSLDGDFQGRLMSTGSSSEGTRVGEPDEFDFLYLLDKLGDSCDIFENGLYLHEGFVQLKVKPSTDMNPVLFDNNGYLDAELVREKLSHLVKIAIQQQQLWKTNELFDIYVMNDCLKPVINLEVRYIGSYFKALDISIDIVPAVYIRGWWPSYLTTQSTKLMHDSVKSAGCALLLQNPSLELGLEEEDQFLRISSAPAEIALFQLLPAFIKKSYALAKVLLGGKVCPSVEENTYGQKIPTGDFITSYMLKNCLLYEVEEIRGDNLTNTYSLSRSEIKNSPRFLSGSSKIESIYSRKILAENECQTETKTRREIKNSSGDTRTAFEKVEGATFYEGYNTKIEEIIYSRKLLAESECQTETKARREIKNSSGDTRTEFEKVEGATFYEGYNTKIEEIIYSRKLLAENECQTVTKTRREIKNSSGDTVTECEKVEGATFYEDHNTNISETVNFTRKTILRLQRCIENGKLPAYFLPKLNILGHEYRTIYGEEFEEVEEAIKSKKKARMHIISILLKCLDAE